MLADPLIADEAVLAQEYAEKNDKMRARRGQLMQGSLSRAEVAALMKRTRSVRASIAQQSHSWMICTLRHDFRAVRGLAAAHEPDETCNVYCEVFDLMLGLPSHVESVHS